jgi:penicillin-binding protein 2
MPDQDWKRIRYGENWSTGDTYNAALGQGFVNVTPLQLISMVSAVANGGTLYQPSIIDSYLDPEGNVVTPYTPHVLRNIDLADASGTLTLLLVEDMIMKGPSSLACTCEQDSEWYNPVRCNPSAYRNTVDVSPDGLIPDIREYQVFIPQNYTFNAQVCNELRFNDRYRPAFVSQDNLDVVQEGMRQAVTIGTAQRANLPYVEVAGKTGTAEYCDDIARPLGLCVPGNWPAHAWFVSYAPYENPEIAIVGFVYNGREGSQWALPVVVETLEAYYRLKNERAGLAPPPPINLPTGPTPVPGG